MRRCDVISGPAVTIAVRAVTVYITHSITPRACSSEFRVVVVQQIE